MSSPQLPRRTLLTGMFAGVIALAACGSDAAEGTGTSATDRTGSSPGTSPGTAAGGVPAADGKRITLRIGDQNKGRQLPFELSGQDQGTSYDIEWVAFTDGPNMNAALTAGKLDIGSMGDTPAIFATVARADIVVIAGQKTNDGFYGLVTSPGSDIANLQDLKGKKIALTLQTAFHGLVLQVLDEAGLQPSDVTLVNVPVAAIASTVAGGDADVATLNGALLTSYLADNPTAHQVPYTNDAYSVLLATHAAVDDPAKRAAIIDFVGRSALAGEWVAANSAAFIDEYYVTILKQDPAVAAETYRRAGPPISKPVDDVLIAHQRKQAALLIAAGVLPGDFSVDGQFDAELATAFATGGSGT